MNHVILMGRIGNDVEMRQTQTGIAVCNFSLATSEKIKGEDHTEWHRIVAWNKTAELIQKYFVKGDPIMVIGKIKTKQWEDKNGEKKYTTEIIVNQLQFIPSSNKKTTGSTDFSAMPKNDSMTGIPSSMNLDDIPF